MRETSSTEPSPQRPWTSPAPYPFMPPNKNVKLGRYKRLKLLRRRDFIEALAWLSGVAVICMFLIDGGFLGLTDLPSYLNATSRVTALLAMDLLLIHTLLVARVPWIDKLYGHDRATLAHKKLGKPVLYLALAHFLASLVSYSITDSKNVWNELISLVTTVPDMWSATLALALMIIVVITSLVVIRRALSYEAWYLIHLLAYASIIAAVPHTFSTGTDIAFHPIAVGFWVTLYVFVAGNILWFRVASPVLKSIRAGWQIAKVTHESSDTVSLYISGRNAAALGGMAGQFHLVRPLTWSQWWRPHPFSLSASPNNNFVRFTIGNRGDDTAQLQHLKPGTRVILEGPYGIFTEERRTNVPVVLIAAGIGIPPIRALAEQMAARPGDITIIYRVRAEGDAPLLRELQTLCARRGMTLHVVAGSRGRNSWLNADPMNRADVQRIRELAPLIADADVYICGPQNWTHSVARSVAKAGTPIEHIHAEEFAW